MKDWKTNMMAYKRSPLSLILRILVIAAACITMFILCAIIIYILVKGIPNLNLKMFAWHYTSDNAVSYTHLDVYKRQLEVWIQRLHRNRLPICIFIIVQKRRRLGRNGCRSGYIRWRSNNLIE